MMVRSQRPVKRTILVSTLLSALVAIAALAPSAGAHAVLTRSEPEAGSTLSQPPKSVRLDFSEEISERFRRVTVLGEHGRPVRAAQVVSGPGSRSLTVRLPKLRRGPYEIVWEVLAEDDGHITSGATAFGVGVKAPRVARASAVAGEPPSTVEPGLRWLDFSLLACAVGGMAVALLLTLAASRAELASLRAPLLAARRRVAGGAAAGSVLALLLGIVLLIRQAHGLLPTLAPGGTLLDALASLLGARWGALWLAHETLFAGMAGLALVLRGERTADRPVAARVGLPAAAVALGLATVRALGGHAAAAGASGLAVAADAVHVLAASLWIGGVVALVVALFPGGSAPAGQTVALARALRRPFSIMAGLSVAALAVTGVYSAGAQVTSVDALLTTFYGETLLAKTGLVLITGLLGLANGRLLRRLVRGQPQAAGAKVRRFMVLEVVLGLEIIAAAAMLTSSSPPRGPEFEAPRPAPVPTLERQHGDLLVTAAVRPNRPGTNAVSVVAASSLRPPPAPVDRVSVRVSAPGDAARRVTLTGIGSGRFTGTLSLPRDGRWRMAVAVGRAGRQISSQFGWTVAPPDRARPVRFSARPLAPLLDRLALIGLLVLALLGAWFLGAGLRRAGRTFIARALRA